jgi:hypothetical protein
MMAYSSKTKPGAPDIRLLVMACTLIFASSCSTSQNDDNPEAAAAVDTAPMAETDAIPLPEPSQDGQLATAGTEQPPGDSGTPAPSPATFAASEPKPAPKKPRKRSRRAALAKITHAAASTDIDMSHAQEPAPPASDDAATQPLDMPAPTAQAIQEQPQPMEAPAQETPPVAAASDMQPMERTPASPRNPPAPASVDGAPAAEGESLIELLMAYRAALMAAAGLALVGVGSIALRKKKQASA